MPENGYSATIKAEAEQLGITPDEWCDFLEERESDRKEISEELQQVPRYRDAA